MTYKVGVDVGGTFTDFLVISGDSRPKVYKTPTTPKDPTEGFRAGLERIAEEKSMPLQSFLRDVDQIIHGTTITTNALLEREGATTGLVTTEGFRDVLNFRRGLRSRDRMYDASYPMPDPLVPRRHVRGVRERVRYDGTVKEPLATGDVSEAAAYFAKNDVEAVAVCFMHAFSNPDHERRAAEILGDELDDVPVSVSSDIYSAPRFYERSSTTVLNSYTRPSLHDYLRDLATMLKERGFDGVLRIMQSNGGVTTPAMAGEFAVNTLLSGPAAGPEAGVFYADPLGVEDVITIDMGGTSFDVSLVEGGDPKVSRENEIGRWFVATPMVDIHTVSAGGGSVAWIDDGDLLRVGPKSAGADPGPVCYGNGGTAPTVTDANLLLGYLNPAFFHGGRTELAVEQTEAIVEEEIARPYDLDVVDAAKSIHDVTNATLADAIRVVSVREGHDPRSFGLVVAGGAGPIHACKLAEELDIPLAVVPRESSVFCATGQVLTDYKHDYVSATRTLVDDARPDAIRDAYEEMVEEARSDLDREGVAEADRQFEPAIDLRYLGQFNEVTVPWQRSIEDPSESLQRTVTRFHEDHERKFGYATPETDVEILALRLSAVGATETFDVEGGQLDSADSDHAIKETRNVYFDDDFVQSRVYAGEQLRPGNRVNGPGIVELETTTIVVTPSYDMTCDENGNFVLHPSGTDLETVVSSLERSH